MLEINSFFAFKGNSVFKMIEQAELNRAFFARYGELSQAEPSFFSQKLEPKLSRAEPSRASARTQH